MLDRRKPAKLSLICCVSLLALCLAVVVIQFAVVVRIVPRRDEELPALVGGGQRPLVEHDLLAHVAVSKYGDHLPLYRQSQIFLRDGVTIHRTTLCDWVRDASDLLRPIVQSMKREILRDT